MTFRFLSMGCATWMVLAAPLLMCAPLQWETRPDFRVMKVTPSQPDGWHSWAAMAMATLRAGRAWGAGRGVDVARWAMAASGG